MIAKEVPTSTSSTAKSMPGASATAVKDKDKSTSNLSFSIDDTLNAEVLWCLKLIDSHWSYNSSRESGKHLCKLSEISFPNKFKFINLIEGPEGVKWEWDWHDLGWKNGIGCTGTGILSTGNGKQNTTWEWDSLFAILKIHKK